MRAAPDAPVEVLAPRRGPPRVPRCSPDLYEVIRHRYERGSIIISSNRAVEEWTPLFADPLMAGAAMDRLLHHSHSLTLEGKTVLRWVCCL